jgi:hypothetical protein
LYNVGSNGAPRNRSGGKSAPPSALELIERPAITLAPTVRADRSYLIAAAGIVQGLYQQTSRAEQVSALDTQVIDHRHRTDEKVRRNVAVVYVVSPDRELQLFRSLYSLLCSGTNFDLIQIYCVGGRLSRWCFADPRISLKTVGPLFGDYFYGNKLYLCETSATTLIFLDADTVVLRPLDLLWQGLKADFLARPGSTMVLPTWNHGVWSNLFQNIDRSPIPMFNSGVLVFQNAVHLRLKDSWRALLLRFLNFGLPWPYPDGRLFEQWSLAMAIAQVGVPFAKLDSKGHAFGWCMESADEAVVFHSGSCAGSCSLLAGICRSQRCGQTNR